MKSAATKTAAHAPGKAPRVWVAQGFWSEQVFRGISRFAHRNGWILDSGMRFERGPVKSPAVRPDGIIVFTLGAPAIEPIVKDLHADGVPVVDTEAYTDRYGAPRVLGDDARVGILAAEHLIATHPARLVALFSASEDRVSGTRRESFLKTALEHGVPAEILREGNFDVRALTKDGPAGIYASSERLASAVLNEARAAGIRVPEDLAILSGDDFGTVCDNTVVPISSIDLDMEEKGYRAAELLDRLMRGGRAPASPVVVPPRGVIARESTKLFRSGNDTADRVVRHLQDNCRRRASLATLCEEIGVPLRTAQHLLKTHLGVSPGELIREFRIQSAARLESSGVLKQDALAQAVGYAGRSGLVRARKHRK